MSTRSLANAPNDDLSLSVPWWPVVSSLTAPIALIGGWTLAAWLQPQGYSSSRDTISELAGHGASHRWVMTTGIAVLGLCHIVTALGIRPARTAGRLLLAVGGVATVLVAAFPLPADDSSTSYHAIPATISFVALSLWPSAAYSSRARVTVLGLRASTAATLAMLALLVTFAIQRNGGGHVGLTERVLAGAQALWPATVVLTLLSAGRRTSRSRYLQ